MLSRNSVNCKSMGHGGKRRRGFGRLKVATDDSASSTSFADDYYSVLGLVINLQILINYLYVVSGIVYGFVFVEYLLILFLLRYKINH